MTTDENRVKMSKYRARKALRKLGYSHDEIATLIAATNWSSTTPAQFLARLKPPEAVADRARVPQETPEPPASARVPRETPEPEEIEGSFTPIDGREFALALAAFTRTYPRVALLVGCGIVLVGAYALTR